MRGKPCYLRVEPFAGHTPLLHPAQPGLLQHLHPRVIVLVITIVLGRTESTLGAARGDPVDALVEEVPVELLRGLLDGVPVVVIVQLALGDVEPEALRTERDVVDGDVRHEPRPLPRVEVQVVLVRDVGEDDHLPRPEVAVVGVAPEDVGGQVVLRPQLRDLEHQTALVRSGLMEVESYLKRGF